MTSFILAIEGRFGIEADMTLLCSADKGCRRVLFITSTLDQRRQAHERNGNANQQHDVVDDDYGP